MQNKRNIMTIMVASLVFFLALIPLLAFGKPQPLKFAGDSNLDELPSSKGNQIHGLKLLNPPPAFVIRHIRSLDEMNENENDENNPNEVEEQQEGGPGPDPQQQEPSNTNTKVPSSPRRTSQSHYRPFVPLNLFSVQPKGGLLLQKWLFRTTSPGTSGSSGPSQFPRGLRRDSHFIRFGRNVGELGEVDGLNLASKKNNFIRLGRENPRRNNFIRLGRSGGSGILGSNEGRQGAKVGYFPDYYSQLFGGNPVVWDFQQQQPVRFDSNDVLQG